MICPNCGHDNVPGSESCGHCQMDLTQLDRPVAHNRIERSLMEDPISVLRPRKPVTLQASAPLKDALRQMLESNVGALLIVDAKNKLVGIFSERDLVLRVAGIHEDWQLLPVEQFMTPNPETVSPKDSLAFGLHKMDVGGYRHLPVVQDGRPVGVISVRDMLRHLTRLCT